MKVVVICGGESSEREVSLVTGRSVFEALKTSFENVLCLECKDGRDCLSKVIDSGADVVFIALHGGFGENGQIQAALELLGIKHTGCTFGPSNIAMNKFATKMILKSEGIPVAEGILVRSEEDLKKVDFFPVCIKPNFEGSSVGVNFVDNFKDLESVGRRLLQEYGELIVERKINGKEITIGILFGKVLPVVHIKPKKGFYDYKNKYTKGATEYVVPADLREEITNLIQQVGLSAYKAIGCNSYARVDMILEGNIPYVLEINSIPGMTPTSLLPKAALAGGINFEELVRLLVEKAC